MKDMQLHVQLRVMIFYGYKILVISKYDNVLANQIQKFALCHRHDVCIASTISMQQIIMQK